MPELLDHLTVPEAIHGEKETEDYVGAVRDELASYNLQPTDLVYPHSRVCLTAAEATLTKARGIGAVILSSSEGTDFPDVVAEGRNDLANEDFDFGHVAHGEIMSIAAFRAANRRRKAEGLEPFDPLKSIMVSSLGPCAMCMIACINQRIGLVMSVAPDWTGGVTMDYIGKEFPGFKTYIDEFDLKSMDAPVNWIPFGEEIAERIRLLCWSASRIKNHVFNVDEHRAGLDYYVTTGPTYLKQTTPEMLYDELEKARLACGFEADRLEVQDIVRWIDNAFHDFRRDELILPEGSILDEKVFHNRFVLEFKILSIRQRTHQLKDHPESRIAGVASSLGPNKNVN